ncbi:solute carrier family 66 member 2 isoform X2, partial [Ixodes scapularis]
MFDKDADAAVLSAAALVGWAFTMAAPIDEVEEDACVNPFSFQRFVSGQNAIDHSQPPAKGRCRLSPTTVGSLRLMDASTEHPWRQFWAWTDFLSYLEFMASFALCTGALLYLFLDCAPLVEALGFLALLTEALLGLPQFWRNLRNRSTRGM